MRKSILPYGENWDNEDVNEYLISFYKERYLYFLKIGIGNYTAFETKVTERLIKATANRLDQLIKGEITEENSNYGYLKSYHPTKLFDSNRSFGWNNTSQFKYLDLDFKQRHSIDYPTMIQETYIDRYTTAYHSIKEYKEYE